LTHFLTKETESVETITVAQRKGGNGKSTATLNLAHAFALSGRRVLVIDLDDQKNATSAIATVGEVPGTTEDLLRDEAVRLEDVASATEWERVSLVASSANLSGTIRTLDGEVGGHQVLRERLDGVDRYDLCLIDTSPSLNILVVNALCASRYLFVPLSSMVFSLYGLTQTMETFTKVRSRLNGELELLAVAFVMHDKRSVLANEVVDTAKHTYGELLCDTIVGRNIAIEEAQTRRQSIFAYAPGNRGAAQYRSLADELLARMNGGR
jgi:chromosome partitioning protein